MLLGTPVAHAINPEPSLTQLGHSAWRLQDGALPGTPNVITQTADGYIWIGTEAGLLRFDGAVFVPVSPPPDQKPVSTRITALYGTRDGSLLIGTSTQLLRLKDGRFYLYRSPVGLFSLVREAPDGRIWATRQHTPDYLGPLCEVHASSLDCYGPQQGVPFKDAGPLAIEKSGRLWVASANKIVRWQSGRSEVFAPAALARKEGLEGFKSVVVAADGTIWSGVIDAGSGLGLQHLANGIWSPFVSQDVDSSTWEVTSLLFDRDDSLWIGTANDGLYRIARSRVDHFGVRDGLSADSVSDLLEDREGNLWVATASGIDKFRPTRVITFSSRQGLSSDGVNAVLASRNGAIWISNATALDKLENEKITSYGQSRGLPGRAPTALFEDARGRLWVGVDDGVAVFDHGRFTRVDSAGSAIGPILEFAAGPGETVWGITATVPSRIVRMSALKVLEIVPAPQGIRFYPLASSPDGSLLMGSNTTVGGCDLVRYANGTWETLSVHNPPYSGGFREIVVQDPRSVFLTTAGGIVAWRDGVGRKLTTDSGLPCSDAYSLVLDRQGDLWAYLQCGVARITAEQLSQWWREPTTKLRIQLLDVSDGALPGLSDFHPRAAVALDGKVWFANSKTLQSLDSQHWVHNDVVPPVRIQALYGDGRSYDTHSLISLPPLIRNVQIDFTALSFVVPQRVKFRYRLDGWDSDWQDPGKRRQSFYTNLRPGRYRFLVTASNDDDLWNRKGDSVEFDIEPALYQTWWFRLLCLAATVVLIQTAYIYRLRRAKAIIQQRLAARLGERERIARELHDTLLQGIQGLILKFHAFANTMPVGSSTRTKLEAVLGQGRTVIEEGRARVRDLRGADRSSTELAEQLSAHAAGYAQTHAAAFTTSVVGKPVDLNPMAADELLTIGREAISNAFTHAQAGRIEVEIIYGDKSLALRVRDDGRGVEQETVQAGRAGHWGIVGMRERARSLGSKLNIWSRSGSGTEVEVTVPAAIAYASSIDERGWRYTLARVRKRLLSLFTSA